jgi:peptidoglycan/LPS O-acetylase OafA/YrhL
MGVLIEYTKGLVPTGDYTVNLVLQGLIVVPMMIALCAVYFVTVERPCMRKDWPKRLLDRVRQTFSREPRKIASPVSDRV